MYGPIHTGQNPQSGQFQTLLAKSVADVLGDAGLKPPTTIAKPQTPSLILPSDEGHEQWVHKPVFFTRIGQMAEFEISKDAAGWWVKASIGYAAHAGAKIAWIHEFLHSNDKEPKIFRLYARNSDPKVSIIDVARRHSMFPLGCDVRLSQ